MKKIVGIVVLVLLVGFLALWMLKAPLMSVYLSKKLKTKVSVGSIEISKSHMKIKKLRVHNPRGYKQKTAFSCNEILITYNYDDLISNPSIISLINLSDSYLYVECKDPLCVSNNWTDLLSKISKRETSNSGREVIVTKLSMTDLNVDINGLGVIPGAKKNIYLDNIEFDNVSSKTGFPTSQLIAAIFKEAGMFDFIKGVMDPIKLMNPNKLLDDNVKSLNPFGKNSSTQSNDDKLEIEDASSL